MTVGFSGTVNYASIQVVEVSGYPQQTIGVSGTNQAIGANSAPLTYIEWNARQRE